MNKILLGLLLFSSTLFSLEWEKDMETALKIAKKEHKNIMLLVEDINCRWCIKMKDRTLSDESVKKRLENFVVVKIMRENADKISELPSIVGVPTIFFMKETKEVIEDVIGSFNVEDFLSYIDDVEKKLK